MPNAASLILLACLVAGGDAVYKRWIPNTEYDEAANWSSGRVPCGNDAARIPSPVSVWVRSLHAVRELQLPPNGELRLAPDAGFRGGSDPACGPGVAVEFRASDSLGWFDPSLWQAAETPEDLQSGHFLFAVHEESVPCRHDDVAMGPSFSVGVAADVVVGTLEASGEKFAAQPDFARFLASGSGRLQFRGPASVAVGTPACGHASGCDCGNRERRGLICGAVACQPPPCGKAVRPAGHCCDVCGAVVIAHHTDAFDLRSYRQRLRRLFLDRPQYEHTHIAVSAVFPNGSAPSIIQVVVLDDQSVEVSVSLAREVMDDARRHGAELGIAGTEIHSSVETRGGAGTAVGVAIGVLILVAAATAVLIRKRVAGGNSQPVGFDNPMFDQSEHNGVNFINPAYDASDVSV